MKVEGRHKLDHFLSYRAGQAFFGWPKVIKQLFTHPVLRLVLPSSYFELVRNNKIAWASAFLEYGSQKKGIRYFQRKTILFEDSQIACCCPAWLASWPSCWRSSQWGKSCYRRSLLGLTTRWLRSYYTGSSLTLADCHDLSCLWGTTY